MLFEKHDKLKRVRQVRLRIGLYDFLPVPLELTPIRKVGLKALACRFIAASHHQQASELVYGILS